MSLIFLSSANPYQFLLWELLLLHPQRKSIVESLGKILQLLSFSSLFITSSILCLCQNHLPLRIFCSCKSFGYVLFLFSPTSSFNLVWTWIPSLAVLLLLLCFFLVIRLSFFSSTILCFLPRCTPLQNSCGLPFLFFWQATSLLFKRLILPKCLSWGVGVWSVQKVPSCVMLKIETFIEEVTRNIVHRTMTSQSPSK